MNESSWSVLGSGLANLNKALPPLPTPTSIKSKLAGPSMSVRSMTSQRTKQLRRSVSAGFASANKLAVPRSDLAIPCIVEPRSPRPLEIGPDPFAAPQEPENACSSRSSPSGSSSRNYVLPVQHDRNSLSADSAYSYLGPSDCSSRDSMEILHEDFELGTARSVILSPAILDGTSSSGGNCGGAKAAAAMSAPPPIVITRPPRSLLRYERAQKGSSASLQSYSRSSRAEARYSCSSFCNLVERTFKTTDDQHGSSSSGLGLVDLADTTIVPAVQMREEEEEEEGAIKPSLASSSAGPATVAIRIPLPPTPPPVVNTLAAASLRQLTGAWEKARSASATEHLNQWNSSSGSSSGGGGGGGGWRRNSTDAYKPPHHHHHHRYETVSERLEARKRELRLKREVAWRSAKTDAFMCSDQVRAPSSSSSCC